jgi:translation initiation factor 2 alpha subunit (eIF-2alpha)
MPDKVEITDMQMFLAKANDQMLTVVPETVRPDLTKIKAFIKMTTKIPEGVTLIEDTEQFKLTLRNTQATDNAE